MIELINWLICGTLLAAATHAVALCAPRVSASLRYHLWWVATATILAAPIVPMLLPEQGITIVHVVQPMPPVAVSASPPNAGWLVAGIWAVIASCSLTRIAVAIIALRQRKREALPFPPEIERQLPLWAARAGRRAARLRVSPMVRSAAVLGGPQPVIAVSPALLQALTPGEIDLVLMHEWAHVQRYDDVANVAQQVVRSLFGLHPGVRWCARQLDLQRELACDARVVNGSGSSKAYAACLARLAEMLNVRADVALAPSVVAGSHLSTRVTAVLRAGPRVSRGQTCVFVATGIAALIAIAASTARVAAVREPVNAAAQMVASVLPQAPREFAAQRPDAVPESTAPRPPARPRARSTAQVLAANLEQQEAAFQLSIQPMTRHLLEPVSDGPPLSDGAAPIPALSTPEFGSSHGVARFVALPAAPEAPQPDPATWLRVADAGVAIADKSSDAGVAIGRKSSDSAKSTAAFFSRMGKSIAGRF